MEELKLLHTLSGKGAIDLLHQLKTLFPPTNHFTMLPNELLTEICLRLAEVSPLTLLSWQLTCSRHQDITKLNPQIWEHALCFHYPQVQVLGPHEAQKQFLKAYLWASNKQWSFDLKPRHMGIWNMNQVMHFHQQVPKYTSSEKRREKLDFQVHESFDVFGHSVLSCGVMPYEYSVPIPNTSLCAHVCRPFRTQHRHQGGSNRVLSLADMHSSTIFYPVEQHTDLISDVALGENTLVTSSVDGSVKVWNICPSTLEPLQLRHTLNGHDGWVNAIDIAGDTIVSGGADYKVNFWNITTGSLCKSFSAVFADFGFGVCSVCLDGERKLFGCGSVFGPYYVYDTDGDQLVHTLDEPLTYSQYTDFVSFKHQEYASIIKFTSSTIVTTSRANDQICVWDLQSGHLLHRLEAGGNIHDFRISVDKEILMCSLCNGSMRLWTTKQSKQPWKRNVSKKRGTGHGITWVYYGDANEDTLCLI
ncbi:WD40-repeat-containing domain protein [Umbelopsis sp. AD052]|nr:WD40-repeat-containing domain protein [Umbelopsis sp. AD052]